MLCVAANSPDDRITYTAFQRGGVVATHYTDGGGARRDIRHFVTATQARDEMLRVVHVLTTTYAMHLGYATELDDQGPEWWANGQLEIDFAAAWVRAAAAVFEARSPGVPAAGLAGAELFLFSGLVAASGLDRTAKVYLELARARGGVIDRYDDLVLVRVPCPERIGCPSAALFRATAAGGAPGAGSPGGAGGPSVIDAGGPRLRPPGWFLCLGAQPAFTDLGALELAMGLLRGRKGDDLRAGQAGAALAAASRIARLHPLGGSGPAVARTPAHVPSPGAGGPG